MSLEIALTEYLIDEIPDVSSRIYPYWLPRKAVLPAIAVHRRSGEYQHEINGSAGFASPEFQFSVFSYDYGQTKDLAEQLRQALQGYSGAMGDEEIYSITNSNEFDLYEPPDDASNRGIYHTASLYNVLYEIQTPTFTPAIGTITNSQVEKAVINYLLSKTALTDLISERLYPLQLPRKATYPAVSMKRSTGGHESDLQGSAGFALPKLDFTVYGMSYGDCLEVRDKLRLLLDGLSGVYSGCNIYAVTAADSSDGPQGPIDGSEAWTAASTISFFVLYQESVPSF